MTVADLNLTRDDCAARGRQLAVDTHRVDLDLSNLEDAEAVTFASRATVRFTSTGTSTWLDLVADEITSLTVNGAPQPFDSYDGARVQLGQLRTDDANEVTVEARCRYSRTGEGLHRFTDPADGNTYVYTHFEPTDARRAFACFEQPDLKTRFTLAVTAPAGSSVFANQSPASDEADGDRHTVTFAPTLPLSSYLTALAVGPFHSVSDVWRADRPDGSTLEVPLGVICRKSMAEHLDAEEIFTITKQGLTFFDEVFQFPYPWGKYDEIFLPEYNIGAMEHPGLVTFSENSYIFRGTPSETQRESRAEVIMHEMAHMWFGDLATPRWWDDTWLKESFADLMGYLAATEAAGFKGSWVTFAVNRKQWAYTQDQLPTTHPIVADIPDLEAARLNFDGITYAKGASVLKQLMAYAGRDAFFRAAQLYFQRHAFGSTNLEDLITCLQETSEADLSDWVPSWLETTGPSTIAVLREGEKLYVTVDSTDKLTGEQIDRKHRVVVSTFALAGTAFERTARVEVTLDAPKVEVELPAGTQVDVAVANDDDLTYALLRLDDMSMTNLTGELSSVQPTLTRAVIWSALWNAVRDGHLHADHYLVAVGRNAVTETDAGLLAMVLRQAATAITGYLHPDERPSEAGQLVAAIDEGLRSATPGSDLQRAWAHALAGSAGLTPAGEEPVRHTLDGGVDGLELTPSLRWDLLAALAELGAIDEARLHDEYASDPTMSGATARDRALASLPGVATKQRVWRELTTDTALTNDKQRALLAGFDVGPDSDAADFVAPYFEQVEQWWQQQTMVMAGRLATGLFPRTNITVGDDEYPPDNPVVRATEQWLADRGDAPQALRRIVIEQLDHTLRRLRAQRG
ncbi:aminopeptidase N [Flexivirga endophytica]|uniref:aminopeptidase N n=1 Tax=Flexivirga endophytica TaxID=1849103 RepID=UPI0019AD99FD|nr:aminopeptidase N [Flexivirga endophytica]GHB60034.1 aminopeptidase [Flexivirga endophytica]